MAEVIPEGWRQLDQLGQQAPRRLLDTIARLAAALPQAYRLYHGVHWTRLQPQGQTSGVIDLAVMNAAGDLLIIEQKTGLLAETSEGLQARYAAGREQVAVALSRRITALQARLRERFGDAGPGLQGLFYCPDHQVRDPGSVGLPAARIVDAGRRDQLAAAVQTALPPGTPAPERVAALHRFLCDLLELRLDASALVGQARALSTRLAGGLAEWARRIECEPFRLRVIATAGSGKTQLALALLQDAVQAGQRPLYLCYNRPLADHIARIAPAGARVLTYHQLGYRIAGERGRAPDFRGPGAYRVLETALTDYQPTPDWQFDALIVDEGQDFRQAWVDPLLRLLRPAGRAWWLEDPMQNLYGREPVQLPGWVRLRSSTNYRSPHDVLTWLRRLCGAGMAGLETGSPLAGAPVELLAYQTPEGLAGQTLKALTRALGAGFTLADIAVVSYRGREHSRLAGSERLGPHRLRRFTGRYDLLGDPVYTPGELHIDTVHRFKGQAAPCVIFTEIEFDELDEGARRRLFVGMTRAMMKLYLVAASQAADLLRPGDQASARQNG